MEIRPCRSEDLELLERHMPSPGRTPRHALRFDKQQRGLSTFLIAWSDGVPVGTTQHPPARPGHRPPPVRR
ncbi:hypothetical protein RB200_06545 [Streptomyces sp. PmtG]